MSGLAGLTLYTGMLYCLLLNHECSFYKDLSDLSENKKLAPVSPVLCVSRK